MKFFIAISVTLMMLAGCGTDAIYAGLPSCASITEPASCPEPGHRQVNIHFIKNREIKLTGAQTPTVSPGQEIRFTLNGDNGTKVTVWGKNSSSDWICGTGTKIQTDNDFRVCVPDDTEDGDYSYFINVEGVGTLDPVVKVIRGN